MDTIDSAPLLDIDGPRATLRLNRPSQHNRIDPDMLLSANRLLKLFMIRRLKDEVEKLMPKKIETKVRA